MLSLKSLRRLAEQARAARDPKRGPFSSLRQLSGVPSRAWAVPRLLWACWAPSYLCLWHFLHTLGTMGKGRESGGTGRRGGSGSTWAQQGDRVSSPQNFCFPGSRGQTAAGATGPAPPSPWAYLSEGETPVYYAASKGSQKALPCSDFLCCAGPQEAFVRPTGTVSKEKSTPPMISWGVHLKSTPSSNTRGVK